jgi:hypothetical protein
MSDSQFADKGGQMEETLRNYFLELGYYVIRGARYAFEGADITDVDLWLYQRSSSFSRQRFNVDVKSRRIPQALERILWAKGLQQCLHLDGVLVATTDTRKTVKEFANLNSVVLLDGTLLGKLKRRYAKSTHRISEEELVQSARAGKGDRLGAEWVERIAQSKSRVLTQLDFDGCNAILNDVQYFVEQMLTVPKRSQIACRFFYLSLSLVIVIIDYIVREFAFIEGQLQTDALNEGLRYGRIGKEGAERVFTTASKIVSAYMPGERIRSADLLKQLQNASMSLPVEILTEFFLKANHGSTLFNLARSFESLAFDRTFYSPADLPSDHRAIIGVVLDFFGIERKKFFDAIPTSPGAERELETGKRLVGTSVTENDQPQRELRIEAESPSSKSTVDEPAKSSDAQKSLQSKSERA